MTDKRIQNIAFAIMFLLRNEFIKEEEVAPIIKNGFKKCKKEYEEIK